jgi:hypothetical protein
MFILFLINYFGSQKDWIRWLNLNVIYVTSEGSSILLTINS